jgi:hypothetical protein
MIGAYWLYNYKVGAHGEPFGMCETHTSGYNPPVLKDGTCRLDKISADSNLNCEDCMHERNL